jgi:hypothetical protein
MSFRDAAGKDSSRGFLVFVVLFSTVVELLSLWALGVFG